MKATHSTPTSVVTWGTVQQGCPPGDGTTQCSVITCSINQGVTGTGTYTAPPLPRPTMWETMNRPDVLPLVYLGIVLIWTIICLTMRWSMEHNNAHELEMQTESEYSDMYDVNEQR